MYVLQKVTITLFQILFVAAAYEQTNVISRARLLASLLALFSIMFLETFVFKEVVRYAAHRVWYSFASVVHDSPYW